jgi:hypothetical protein
MAASTPERIPGQLVLLRGLLAGGALGAVCIASAGLVLFDAEGLLTGATGLTATILAALLTGLWAGAPGDDDALPFTERWIACGIATAVAGGFATFLTLYGAVGPGPLTRAISLIALVAAPVYAIGMLLPVLLAWGEQLQQEVADAQGEDPEEGVVGRLVVGVLGGAAVGILVAGVVLVSWLGAGPLLLAVAVMLFAPVVLPEPEIAVANERLLAESHTPFSHIRVTEVVFPGERQPERRLYIGEEQESGELVRSGAPTLAYIVAGESWLTGSTRAGASYLFLGGGAYTLPRRISERDPSASITVVELDPEITRAANRFFGLRRDHSIRSVHGDARAFLEADHRSWDRIYLDVYSGSEALPYPMVTREAFEAARDRLSPDGLLGVNLIGVVGGGEGVKVWSVVRTLADVFPAVAVYSHFGADYPDRQNLLVIAGVHESTSFPGRAGLFERWPRNAWPAAGTTVYRDIFPPPPARDGAAPRERVN